MNMLLQLTVSLLLLSLSTQAAITQNEFNTVIKTFISHVSDKVERGGNRLVVEDDWYDSDFGGTVDRFGKKIVIYVTGMIPRMSDTTKEGFMLVLCHELGHLIGGYPYRSRREKISAEGQSDYFASLACFKWVYPDQSQELFPKAALSFAVFTAILQREDPTKLSPNTPHPRVVPRTMTGHPEAQCRLDTLYAGYFERPRPQCWFNR